MEICFISKDQEGSWICWGLPRVSFLIAEQREITIACDLACLYRPVVLFSVSLFSSCYLFCNGNLLFSKKVDGTDSKSNLIRFRELSKLAAGSKRFHSKALETKLQRIEENEEATN